MIKAWLAGGGECMGWGGSVSSVVRCHWCVGCRGGYSWRHLAGVVMNAESVMRISGVVVNWKWETGKSHSKTPHMN